MASITFSGFACLAEMGTRVKDSDSSRDFWDLRLACNDLRLDLKDLRLDMGLEAW